MLYTERVKALITYLKANGYDINLQTNGTKYDATCFDLSDIVDMDMKTPITKEKSNKNLIKYLGPKDYVKLLINDLKDLDYAREINEITKEVGCGIVLQPYNIMKSDDEETLISKLKWIIEEVSKDKIEWNENLRILPQLHVLLWGNKKGV
jgi:7-carboxy-7-deazaguanine synthase